METILHLLPLTSAQQDAFRAAAPEEEHLFLPTNDRRGAVDIPPEWRERTTILMGFVPPEDLKTFPHLRWVQSWNAGVDPYLVPGVLPEGVALTCAAGAYGPAVSEHMLAMLLAIYKRLPAYLVGPLRNLFPFGGLNGVRVESGQHTVGDRNLAGGYGQDRRGRFADNAVLYQIQHISSRRFRRKDRGGIDFRGFGHGIALGQLRGV